MKKRQLLVFLVAASSYIVQMMIIPKSITIVIVLLIGMLLGLECMVEQHKSHSIYIPTVVKYFFPFYLFVLISCLWTINTNMFSFVLIRATLAFEYTWFIAYNSRSISSIKYPLNGLILGAIISSAVVLYFQYNLIGVIRLGEEIYGSAMEYSGGIIFANIACIIMWILEKEKKYLVLSGLFFIMCALSGSRSALALPLIFFAFFYLLNTQKVVQMLKIGAILAICSGIMLTASLKVPVLYNVVGKRIETLLDEDQKDWSAIERKELKKLAWEIWIDNPLVGLGCHGFGKVNEARTGKNMYSHCDYAELFSCYGIVGATLFYTPFILLLRGKKILRFAKRNVLYASFLAFIMVMAVHSSATIFYINIREMIMVGLVFFTIDRINHGRFV